MQKCPERENLYFQKHGQSSAFHEASVSFKREDSAHSWCLFKDKEINVPCFHLGMADSYFESGIFHFFMLKLLFFNQTLSVDVFGDMSVASCSIMTTTRCYFCVMLAARVVHQRWRGVKSYEMQECVSPTSSLPNSNFMGF